ncbi:hypothetical protein COL32_14450 [Bacillus pseudomycoides]|uniref:hypothetical protein n=1 Tax=Bacillus pseudomycoides TaxID=64104 RepID=UPI000BFA1C57|nr:hypothetical protein [Bacillus pseudomycoides]PFX43529.1 hypothetical protein COL32_14450 [Bacillus pseudomycoides]
MKEIENTHDSNDNQYEQSNSAIEISQAPKYKDATRFRALKQFSAFAPPAVFGPLQTIQNHIGPVTMTISYRSEADASSVVGKVVYWGGNGDIEKEFLDEITFTTGDAIAVVKVAFKSQGVTGSTVIGTVTG